MTMRLIAEARLAGIHLLASGDRLHVEARPGALTTEWRTRLAKAKPELLRTLQAPTLSDGDREAVITMTRDYMAALAKAEGVNPAGVLQLADADLLGYATVPDFVERNWAAHVRALAGRVGR